MLVSDSTVHFICGGGSSVVNIVLTFPINKLMFRQQLHGSTTIRALKQLSREGAFTLYRGLLPPLIQKSASVSIMFGNFNFFSKSLQENLNFGKFSSTLCASCIAGSVETLLTPFERIQTLLQDPKHNLVYRNTNDAFTKVVRDYGVRELYRGATPIIYRNTSSNVMFFGLRELVENNGVSTTSHFISGAFIGAICSTIVYPINVVKTRMQSGVGGEMISFKDSFTIVFNDRNRSWQKVYRGLHLNLIRSALSWGIINAAYEKLLNFFEE